MEWAAPVGQDDVRIKRTISIGVFLTAAILLFARLGHYSLWDDEAINALHALGILRTGDTTAVVGDNIVGYRGGATLDGLRERYTPPLGFYMTAPSIGLLGQSAWAARLPFALCGLASVGVLLLWLKRADADLATWILMSEAILGNVSFFLYCRQCRYYGVAILATSVLAFLYVFRDGRRRVVVAFALLSLVLLAANYLNYVAFYACLAVDYLIWGRRRQPLAPGDWPWLILPQLALGTPIVLVWNPLGKNVVYYQATHWLAEKVTLLWWNWRDLDRCEFGVGLLILAAPLIYAYTRRGWLLRLYLAVFIYLVSVTTASPQPVERTSDADVRYLAPLMPLFMTIGVLCLREITRKPIPAALMGLVVFGTNLLHGRQVLEKGWRSTLIAYAGELARPPGDPYTTAALWINRNVPDGSSVWVQPDYMVYPLMFHAPKAIYAWQFTLPAAPQFNGLPSIHFRGAEIPDFVLAFGPTAPVLASQLESVPDGKYRFERVAVLDTFWLDLFRPELIWREFRPIPVEDPATQAIHVFRRVTPPMIRRRPTAAGEERSESRTHAMPGPAASPSPGRSLLPAEAQTGS